MNAIFTGRRRSGKTTLAFKMALDGGGGIVVFDPKREFRGWPATVSDVSQLDQKAKEKNLVIVYHPNGDTEEEFRPVADWIISQHDLAMSKGWDSKGFHFTLLCDEAHNLQGPNWANPQLLQILSQNRPEILNVYQTFQSPKDAYNRIKSRVSDWFIFSTNLPSDLDYLQKEIGVNEEDTARITTLDDHQFAHFHFDGGQPVAEFVTEPNDWYVDLNFSKEQEKEMAERNEDDRRDKKMQYPVQMESDQDIFDAYNMVNKRKKDDPKSKYRGRKTDREGAGGDNREGGRGKAITFGEVRKKASGE
jgi:hypothetical protein